MRAILISTVLGLASVNEGSQFYLPPTCLYTYAMSHPAFTPQLRSITELWPVLISRPVEGRRLNWSRWLVKYRGVLYSLQNWSFRDNCN